jgi:hypothetical protein
MAKDAHDLYYEEVRKKQWEEREAERLDFNRRLELASRPANRREAISKLLQEEITKGLDHE